MLRCESIQHVDHPPSFKIKKKMKIREKKDGRGAKEIYMFIFFNKRAFFFYRTGCDETILYDTIRHGKSTNIPDNGRRIKLYKHVLHQEWEKWFIC